MGRTASFADKRETAAALPTFSEPPRWNHSKNQSFSRRLATAEGLQTSPLTALSPRPPSVFAAHVCDIGLPNWRASHESRLGSSATCGAWLSRRGGPARPRRPIKAVGPFTALQANIPGQAKAARLTNAYTRKFLNERRRADPDRAVGRQTRKNLGLKGDTHLRKIRQVDAHVHLVGDRIRVVAGGFSRAGAARRRRQDGRLLRWRNFHQERFLTNVPVVAGTF